MGVGLAVVIKEFCCVFQLFFKVLSSVGPKGVGKTTSMAKSPIFSFSHAQLDLIYKKAPFYIAKARSHTPDPSKPFKPCPCLVCTKYGKPPIQAHGAGV